MAKPNLSDEEKKVIIEALNNNTEPPPELMTKLFPGLAEKFDVAKLDRAKVVTLEYAGKRSEAAILNQASPTDAGSPLQVERCFKGGTLTGETQLDLFKKAKHRTDDNWQNLIVQGDNLQFLKTCYRNADPLIKDRVKGKVKLIYIDPPFATRSDFKGSKDEKSYSDKVDSAEFIEGLRERLIYMRKILAEDGSIYVHLDQKMIHYVKIVLDEIFRGGGFVNEIVWKRQSAHNDPGRCGVIHDTILLYSTSQNRIWNRVLTSPSPDYVEQFFDQIEPETNRRYARGDLSAGGLSGGGYEYVFKGVRHVWRCPKSTMEKYAKEGRLHWPKKGVPRLKRYLDEFEGVPLQNIWADIRVIHNRSPERLAYPTQKPETRDFA